jgi:hypothetical protein
VNEIISNPTKENILQANEIIKSDVKLPSETKQELMDKLKADYVDLFRIDELPSDYDTLKNEAKFLSGMATYSLVLMSYRLIKIRDEQLYKNDGYSNFKQFVENELPISRTTVYEYIDIVKFFGVRPGGHEHIEYTKLRAAMPLLKAKNEDIPKDEIKTEFVENLAKKSKREYYDRAKELKLKYGLIKSVTEDSDDNEYFKKIEDLISNAPKYLSQKERDRVIILIDKLKTLLES